MFHREFPASDEPILQAALRGFAIDPARAHVDHPPGVQGFSGAVIRRITVAERIDAALTIMRAPTIYCLRGWPSSALPHARLMELHRFLRFVRDEGVHVVAVPIAATTGETLILSGGRKWQLEPWMPGTADFKRISTDSRLNSAMDTLARFHKAAARYRPTAAGRTWFSEPLVAPSPSVRERLSLVDLWSDWRLQEAATGMNHDPDRRFGDVAGEIIDRFRSMRDRLRAELIEMLETPVPLQVCLRDVWHDHVLFTGDEVTGLVDPSAARVECVAADLSRLLGSLLGSWGERWEVALQSYCGTRPLSPNEYRLIGVLHRSGALLSGMTWIERRLRDEIPGDTMPAIVSRLEDFRSQLGGI